MAQQKFRVLNPRNIDPGVRIIAGTYQGQDYEWFAGDELTPPPGMTQEDLDWLLEHRLIEPIRRAGRTQ